MAEKVEIVATGRDGGASAMLRRVDSGMARLGATASTVRGSFSRMMSGLTSPFRAASAGLSRILNLRNMLLAGAGGVVAKSVLTPSIDMQDWKMQLAVLLGSMEKADQEIATLEKRAAFTPFQLRGLVEGYRQLQVFTDGALNAEDGFKMVGDTAAGTGKRFGEVAYWVGRLYSDMKNGNPILDSVGALQRLGALGGTVRGRLESLQKTGASFSDMWAVVTKDMSRFTGMMDKMSTTTGGRLSTLADNWEAVRRIVGNEVVPVLDTAIDDLLGTLREMQASGDLQQWGADARRTLEMVYTGAKEFAGFVSQNGDLLLKLGLTAMGARSILATASAITTLGTAARILQGAGATAAGIEAINAASAVATVRGAAANAMYLKHAESLMVVNGAAAAAAPAVGGLAATLGNLALAGGVAVAAFSLSKWLTEATEFDEVLGNIIVRMQGLKMPDEAAANLRQATDKFEAKRLWQQRFEGKGGLHGRNEGGQNFEEWWRAEQLKRGGVNINAAGQSAAGPTTSWTGEDDLSRIIRRAEVVRGSQIGVGEAEAAAAANGDSMYAFQQMLIRGAPPSPGAARTDVMVAGAGAPGGGGGITINGDIHVEANNMDEFVDSIPRPTGPEQS